MDFAVALVAVLAISLFFVTRFKLNAAVAPFFTISLIIIWMCLLGMLNLLVLSVWLILIFALFSLVWVFAIKKVPLKEVFTSFCTPGIVFFFVISIVFYITLRIKNPYFAVWDEFSFWGTAAKSVFVERQLYTFFTTSIPLSYPPSLPLWSFFVQFFGGTFSEWKAYLAYDILMMSVMTMLFARIKWKNIASILALSFFSVAILYVFWWTFEGRVLYCTTYADIPIGVVFGGSVLGYFLAGDNKAMRWLVPLAGITTLAFIKDTGMALGLIAAGVIAVDMVLSKDYPFETFLRSKKKWLRLIYPLTLFAAAVFAYLLWNAHFSAHTLLERTPNPYPYSFFELLAGKDDYFIEMMRRMTDALFVEQIVTFGTTFEMILVLTILPIVIGLFTGDKKRFIRITVFSLLMAAGFIAYYYFHAYLYTTVFTYRDYNLTGYGRYLSSHAAGWVIAVGGICFSELAAATPRLKKFNFAPAIAIVLLLACSNMFFLNVHPDQYVFTSYKVELGLHGIRQQMQDVYARYEDALTEDDRVYFVCQESNGGEYFYFNYEWIPTITIRAKGTGDFVSPDTPDEDLQGYQTQVGLNDFIDHLRETETTLVYVYHIDHYFFYEMRPIFTDWLTGAVDKTVFLYLVVDNGGDDFQLVPVNNAQHLEMLRAQYGITN